MIAKAFGRMQEKSCSLLTLTAAILSIRILPAYHGPTAFAGSQQSMRVMLTVTAGPHKGRVFVFSGHDTFLVGRSHRAHFQLPRKDTYFSRIHFMVEVNPPHCRIVDMGSRNGTHVNGEKVDMADLRPGDRIKAGRTILR